MIDVSCAIITRPEGQVLVTQRSEQMRLPLKWEFPGGKIEPGETAQECLIREISEELGVTIEITASLKPAVHDNGKQIIKLIPFECSIITGEIKLAEHTAFLWLMPEELSGLDWAEADLPVLQDYLDSRPK